MALSLFARYDLDPVLKAVNYLAVECNYGGRVTDYYDRRLLRTMLGKRFTADVALTPECPLSESGSYKVPARLEYHQVLDHINHLPTIQVPDGLGENKLLLIGEMCQDP